MSTLQPRAALPKPRLTAEEFWELVHRPENADRFLELIRGEVVEMSRPSRKHGIIQVNIGTLLSIFARHRGRGYVASESGLVLEDDPATVVGPDVAFYDDAHSYAEVPAKWGEAMPLLAVEILSPADRFSHIIQRVHMYHRAGVRAVWVVDPESQSVTVYEASGDVRSLSADAELDGGSALPGFRCRLSEVFRLPGEGASGQVAGLPADRSPPSGAGGEGDRRSASGEATGEP